jgi:P-type Mg2+ transporter
MENKNFSFYANMSPQEIFTDLQTFAAGLTTAEAERRYALYGPNATTEKTITWFTIFKNQISNPFFFMFLIVAAIYFFTNQITESIVLITIMVINTCIGFYQEYQSNQAMALLQSYIRATTTVSRAGADITIPINQIVPGDIIVLKAGDIVSADCRIIESENLIVDEASLTGESLPIKKSHEVQQQKITELYNATTCCFAGTVVVDGAGTAVVFATGARTELGFIALLATRTITKSNLTKGTMQLAQTVLLVVLISLVIVIFINVFVKAEKTSVVNILFFAAALAITAIPSALPIVITFCLTKGAMALRQHKMIVKRLSAIEDLGGIEVFCTDKTGTLTENSLSVNDVYTVHDHDTLLYAALASHRAAHTVTSHSFDDAIAQKLTPEQTAALKDYTIIKELPFTYERHRSITLAQKGDMYVLITKGSAEYIITKCPSLTESEITSLNEWIKESEMRGNRVLAVATKITSASVDAELDTYDAAYDTISLISFVDPLKSTAHDAIKKAQTLGVQIKVFSGDSPYVCFTIAQQLGLETDMNNVVHGTDFENSTEEQKMFLVNNRTIFARVTPEQKYQMIAYLQRTYSVGYMGDGINDAPALKIANVGIVVNDAAPVAREAAEIIMLQKSLLNIVLGIEEGRTIIINTLKYIKITISSNVGNFYSLVFSSLLINYLPMLPLQLLFLDLVTDFPLIAISTDAVNHQELRKPLQYSMKDISFVTFLFGLVSSPFDFMIFAFFKYNPATLQTSWFIASSLTQLALIFSLRTKMPFWRAHRPSFALTILSLGSAIMVTGLPFTEFGQRVFLFEQPTLHNLFIICCIILAYFITTETVKILYYRPHSGK